MRNRLHASMLLWLVTPVALAQPIKGQPQDTSSEQLWRAYADDLSGFLVGPDAKVDGLHLLTVLEPIDTSEGPEGNFDRIVNWCDPIPEHSPIYTRTNRKVSGSYQNYLHSLSYRQVPDAKKDEIKALRATYLAATSKANRLESQVGESWRRFSYSERYKPADRKTSYDVWYAREWGAKVGAALADVPVAASAWANALARAYGGYQNVADALISLENSGARVNAKAQSGLETQLLSCSLGAANALPNFIASGDANAAAGTYAFETTLSTDAGQKTVEKWAVSARGGFGGYFGGKAKGERTKISEDDRKFQMTVRFRNLGRVMISRDWYRPDVVALVNKPDQFLRGAIANPDNLWGANGTWRLTPTSVFIGYKPSLDIVFSTRDYDYAYTKWSAGGGFAIGSFWIGARGSGSKETTTWDDQKKTLHVEYNTPDVYAVAVASSFMPLGTSYASAP